MVEEVLLRGIETPRTVVATHYYDVLLNGLILREETSLDSRMENPFTPAHMEVLWPREQARGDVAGLGEMVHLFR